MAEKTFDELLSGAQTIRDNELPESNTHALVGEQLVNMVDKIKEEDSKLAELSSEQGIYNVDANIPLEGQFYTSTTARSAVPTSVRKLGLIITYKTDSTTSVTEQFTGPSISAWTTETNWTSVGSAGGNKILTWTGDVATTRKQVPSKERKPGMQISYRNGDGIWINEQYIGDILADVQWSDSRYWNVLNEVLDTLGDNDSKPMSQKSVTDITSILHVEFETDISTTRKKVPAAARKKGFILSFFHPDNGLTIERCIADNVSSDTSWILDRNWNSENINNQTFNFGKDFSFVVPFNALNKRVDTASGIINDIANYKSILYLPVNDYSIIEADYVQGASYMIAGYNENKEFVRALVKNANSGPISLYDFEGIKYVCISCLLGVIRAGLNIQKIIDGLNKTLYAEDVQDPYFEKNQHTLNTEFSDNIGETEYEFKPEFESGSFSSVTGYPLDNINQVRNKNGEFIYFPYEKIELSVNSPEGLTLTSAQIWCYSDKEPESFISRAVGTNVELPPNTKFIHISLFYRDEDLSERTNDFDGSTTVFVKGRGLKKDVDNLIKSLSKPNGIATLGSDGKVLSSQLPDGIKDVDLSLNKESSNPIANSAVSVKLEEQNNRIKALEVSSGGGSSNFNHIVYVTTYGAKGDGISDDTTAIITALDVVKNRGGGTLYFPATSKNVYLTRKGIVLSNNIKVDSDYGVILKNGSAVLNDHKGNPGNGKCYIVNVTQIAETGSHTITVDNTDGLAIGQEITIADSSCGSYTETLADIISISGNVITFDTSRFTAEGNDEGIINTIDIGGYVLTDFSLIKTCMHIDAVDVSVDNITLDACGNDNEPYIYTISPINQTKQTYTKQENFHIRNVKILNSSQDGISVQGEKNIKITDCYIDNIKYKGIHWGTSCQNVDVEGNILYRCGKTDDTVAGVSNGGAGALYYCVNNHRVTIRNNKILQCYRGVFGFDYRGKGETDTDTIVEGNYLESISKEGILLKAGKRIIVHNNIFKQFDNDSIPIRVEVEGDEKLQLAIISSNIIDDFGSNYNNQLGDIIVAGADRCIITENVIQGDLRKIRVNSDNSIVSSNLCVVESDGLNNIVKDNLSD